MNKIYKTSWNRARGAVTVSSEVSSSVQGMGAKSIIAAAVTAMIAGGAMAAEGDIWTDRVITEDVTIASGTTEYVNSAVMQGGTLTVDGRLYYDSKNSKGDFTLRDGTINVTNVTGLGSYEVRDLVISGGKITATGTATVDEAHGRTFPAVGAYNSWLMTGGDIELSKSGRIWIGSSNKNDPTSYGRMVLQGGSVTLNDGGYITGTKQLYTEGTEVNGTALTEDVLAGNTIGFDGATVTVKGAGNVIDALYTEQTAGKMTVEAGAALTVRATTSTNNDTEVARTAIQKNSTWTIAGGEFVNKGLVTVDVRELLVSGGKLSFDKGSWLGWNTSSDATIDKARLKVTGGELVLANLAGIDMRTVEIAGGHITVGDDQGDAAGAGAGNSVRTSPSLGAYHEFTMTNGTVDLGNNGRLWIGSAAKESLGFNDMRLIGGTVNMNGTKDYQSWITGTVTEADTVKNGNNVILEGTTLNVNGYGEVNAAHIYVDGSAINVAANGVLTFGSTFSSNSSNKGTEYADGTLKFTSGSFNVSGLLKSEIAAEMAGDFTMTDVVVGNLASGATEPTTGFRFDKTLTVTGGTTTITGKLANAASSLVLDGGVLAVNASSIFKADLTELDADTTKIGGTGGMLEVNFGGATLTEAALKTLKNAVYGGRWSAVGLTISDFTPEEDGTISADDSLLVGDAIASDYAVSAGTTGKLDATSVSGQVDVSKVTADAGGKKTVSINASSGTATVTLIGKNGALTNDTGVVDFSVDTGDTLVIGSEAVNNGAVTHNGDITGSGTLELVNTNLTVSNISTTTTNVASNATVTADTVSTSGTVSGTLVANTITGDSSGLTVAGAAQVNGKTVEGVAQSAISGKVTVEDAGIIATNLAAAKRVAAQIVAEDVAAGETEVTAPAILYVDKQLKVASGAAITVGTDPTDGAAYVAPRAGGENVILKENGMLVVDASAFTLASAPAEGDTTDYSVLGKDTTVDTGSGEVYFVNTTKTGYVDLGGEISGASADNVDTDSIYVVLDETNSDYTNGIVALSFNDQLFGNPESTVSQRLGSLFKTGLTAKESSILYALQDNTAFWAEDDTAGTLSYTVAGQKAYEQATGGNVTAGVLNVAYDVNAQVTDAIVRHQLADHQGYGAWADVFYASNEAKKLYGNSGYKADIYGGVLGFDATFSCGATGGIALTIGQADADTVGGALKNSVDSDFWGVSLYAAKDFAGLNVKMDVGYIDFSNDFSGIGDASDASTFTVGLRGDYAAYAGDMFSVVPHVGLRYTKIDSDSVAFNDAQTMDVLEAPIGVKVVGTVEANGWKVLPAVDFTVVPQLGDKDVKAFGYANDVTVLSGGLYNTTVGVEAVNGNLAFGLNASYGFGPDDRANTMVNANVRYSF